MVSKKLKRAEDPDIWLDHAQTCLRRRRNSPGINTSEVLKANSTRVSKIPMGSDAYSSCHCT